MDKNLRIYFFLNLFLGLVVSLLFFFNDSFADIIFQIFGRNLNFWTYPIVVFIALGLLWIMVSGLISALKKKKIIAKSFQGYLLGFISAYTIFLLLAFIASSRFGLF